MAWVRCSLGIAVAVWACATCNGQPAAGIQAHAASAESDEPGKLVDVATLIRTAHRRAQSARSHEALGDVLDRCRQLKRVQLTDRSERYVNQLASWTLNQRGRLFVAEAADRQRRGDQEMARALERRALADFEVAVRLAPRHWQAIHNRGVSLAQRGDFEAAIRDFTTTIRYQPQYANAWFNRAELRVRLGQYDDAVRDYTQVLQLRGDDAESYSARAFANVQRGRLDAALADIDMVVQLQPDHAVAYADRAGIHAAMGHWQRAANDYREAIRLDDTLGQAYHGAAWLMATCPDPGFRDPELALRAAQRAIQLDGSDNYAYLDTLAAAQAAAGQYEQARKSVAEAIHAAPQEAADELRVRLATYEKGEPYRESSPVREATARGGVPTSHAQARRAGPH